MVIDTLEDEVIGDCGDKLVTTAGVAVRPFWWSNECLEVLGLATSAEIDTTSGGESTDTSTGGTDKTDSGSGREGGQGSGNDAVTIADGQDHGLSGLWIIVIAALAVVVVAALAVIAFLIGRGAGKRGPGGSAVSGGASVPGFEATEAQEDSRPAFCPNCGAAINQGAKFCPTCGGQL